MKKIGVIGLGYVGLPLARLFATKYKVVGYDINDERIKELKNGNDKTLEVNEKELKAVIISDLKKDKGLFCSNKLEDLSECNYYIVTVPTPVDKNNRPVLKPLIEASKTVGKNLKKEDIVIYESTVYPGVTEEECVPILEKYSGLEFNKDFFVGYSPERINPGDKVNTIDKILKITSGSTIKVAKKVDELYKSIIKAGTHLAPSIKVAEAAKIIENSQRDINIAFINELAKIFSLMEIDTNDVLEAAGTKWNFLPFKPGLVGGHCIGVDPYYLAQRAEEFGYHPSIILSGRRMNDGMGEYVASQVVKLMITKGISIKESKVLILGFTFKENCPDVRNTRVIDVYKNLREYGISIDLVDPWADTEEVLREYRVISMKTIPDNQYDAVVLTVNHDEFKEIDLQSVLKENAVVYDVKGGLPREVVDKRL